MDNFNAKYYKEIEKYLKDNCSLLEIRNNLIIKYNIGKRFPLLALIKQDNHLLNLMNNYESNLNKLITINNKYLFKYNSNSIFYIKIKKELDNFNLLSEISNHLKVNINTISKFIMSHKKLRHQLFTNIKLENEKMKQMSSLERQTYKFLLLNNIDFKYQHIFKDCKNKYPLPFDFYIPNLNTVIELQGGQHYKSTELFGGKEQFKLRKQNDIIKDKYCFKNHINLLKIHYSANIKDVLTKNKIIKNNYSNIKTQENNLTLMKLPNYNEFIIYNEYLNNKNYINYQYKQNLIKDNIVNNQFINNKINEFLPYNIRYTKKFKKKLFEFSKENNILQQINPKYHRSKKYFLAMATLIFFNNDLLIKFIKKYNLKSVLDIKINFMITDYDKYIYNLLLKNNIINQKTKFDKLLAKRTYHSFPITDYSGKIINNIKIIRPVFSNENGTWFYQCQCFCGNKFVTVINFIKNNKNVSCGCLKEKIMKEAAIKISKATTESIKESNKKLKQKNIHWRYVKKLNKKINGHKISIFKCIFCGKEKEIYNCNILKDPYCDCSESLKLKFENDKRIFYLKYKDEINEAEKQLNATFYKIDRSKEQKEFYIYLKCNKCHKIYSRRIGKLRLLQRCPECLKNKNSKNGITEHFNEICQKKGYTNYKLINIIRKGKENRVYYQILCDDYGIFEISKANFERGTGDVRNKVKCPEFNQMLLNKQLNFINQYRFNSLNKLPFDYYLLDKQVLIQLEPDFRRSKKAQQKFMEKLKIQKEFAEKNNYKLIYVTREQINDIIKK